VWPAAPGGRAWLPRPEEQALAMMLDGWRAQRLALGAVARPQRAVGVIAHTEAFPWSWMPVDEGFTDPRTVRELRASTLGSYQEALRLFRRYMTNPAYRAEAVRGATRDTSGTGLPVGSAPHRGPVAGCLDVQPGRTSASPPSRTSNNHGVFLLPGAVASLVVDPHGTFTGEWLDDVSDLVTPSGHRGDNLEGAAK
jgi:hypothetical protein